MKVLIVCGGTGGHVFPALGLAEKLKKENAEILFVSTRHKIAEEITKRDYRLKKISIQKISLDSWGGIITSIFRLIKSIPESFLILNSFNPDVAVGFGGYVCGPLLLFAHFLKVPTIIHEQNIILGRANRILSKFVDKIAISFPQTENYFSSRKTVLTGCPLNPEIFDVSRKEALDFFGFQVDKFTILVMGGSQGSHKINKTFLDVASSLEGKKDIQIIHLCGINDYDSISKTYRELKVNHRIFSFLKEMRYAYKAADMVIGRAGAATLSEIIFFKLPAILIPYPFAYKHQRYNAEVLAQINSAILIDDRDLSKKILKERIISLVKDKDIIQKMREEFTEMYRNDASENLKNEIMSLIE